MRVCRTCEEVLSDNNWYPSSKKNYNYECNSCLALRAKKNRASRGEEWLSYKRDYSKKRRATNRCYNLRANYGISLEEWKRLFEAQGGKCAICETTEEPSTGWHTDHCHKIGKIRGILCLNCNTGLGRFKDDVALLKKAIKYLV